MNLGSFFGIDLSDWEVGVGCASFLFCLDISRGVTNAAKIAEFLDAIGKLPSAWACELAIDALETVEKKP
jgi:hypothetical protein